MYSEPIQRSTMFPAADVDNGRTCVGGDGSGDQIAKGIVNSVPGGTETASATSAKLARTRNAKN
jgi:hypothetical protein